MKNFTVTLTINYHCDAETEKEAYDMACSELSGRFDLIDSEIKENKPEEDE
jgi:hypothetical protein